MTPEYQPPLSQPPQKQKSRALPWILGGGAVLLLAAVVLGVGGFAVYRWRLAKIANENSSGGSHTGSSEGAQPDASSSPANSNNNANESAPPPPPTGEAAPTTWEATASSLTGDDGQTFTFTCSAGGSAHSVWGSDIYTTDSSICTAGVHSGLITYERGGSVTIELRPGRAVYGSTVRNGVTTSTYGPYRRSFIFNSANASEGQKEADDITPILWSTPASILTYEEGKSYKFNCPAGGKESTIWGTDVYTSDSSICTAAAHVGLIKLDTGGVVTVELRPGQSSYQGTARNGVKSIDYGTYPHSFVVK